jgi:putative PEP-CTERM system TPR-repeat lipoprotein
MKHLPAFPMTKAALAALLAALVLAGCGGSNPEKMVASARDFLEKSDPKSAIIQLKNALQEKPENPEARFLLGQALIRTGDMAGAESELRKALALKHPPEAVVPLLVKALAGQGQFKKLTEEFGNTNLPSPQAQAELKIALVPAYSAQGKTNEAQAALGAALAADPNNPAAQLIGARDKASKRDIDGAMAMVDAILARVPTYEEAHRFKGDLLAFGRDDAAGAMAAYRKSVEVKPNFIEGHGSILTQLFRERKLDEAAKQLDALRKVAPGLPTTVYFDTMLAYQKRDIKAAKERSQQLMKLASNSPLALQLSGAVELEANSLIQAESYLAKSLQLAPDVVLTRRLLTTVYLRSGQGAKALATAQPFIKEADKLDATLNALLGEVFLQNADPKRAEEFFARATKLDPKNERTRTALALTQVAGGRADTGMAELQEISATETGTTATMALISTHLRRGELDKALKAIDLLEKKQPGKPLAHNLRGRTLLAKKDVTGARKSFERSLEIDPTYFASVASLAAMDMADKKPEEARKRFEAVVAKDPKNGPALLALAELRLRSGGPKEEVAEMVNRAITANPSEKGPRLLLINYHLRNKDSKQALSVAQNAVATLPESPELQDALGQALLATGDTNQALAAFNKVSAMQPGSPLPFMRIADAHLAGNNKKAAIESLRRAMAIKPDELEVQRRLIALLIDEKNVPEAVRVARDVQRQQPKSAAGYLLEGEIALTQKNWSGAADVFRTGLKTVPSPVLAVKAHAALLEGGKKDEAEKFAATWLKEKPVDPAFRSHLGDVASTRKDYVEAERQYQSVLRLQPANAIALNNLAWVSGKLNKDGIPMALKALELVPEEPAFMDTLAGLYSDKGDYGKALEWQTRTVARAPGQPLYKLNLAKIHIKGGKKDLARKELDELAKLGDKFVRQAEVAAMLKTL